MEWDVVAVLSSPTIMITQKHLFVNRKIKNFLTFYYMNITGRSENLKILNIFRFLPIGGTCLRYTGSAVAQPPRTVKAEKNSWFRRARNFFREWGLRPSLDSLFRLRWWGPTKLARELRSAQYLLWEGLPP